MRWHSRVMAMKTLKPQRPELQIGEARSGSHAATESSIYKRHHRLRIPGARGRALWRHFIDAPQVIRAEFHAQRTRILLQIFAPLRPWNRNDVFALRE